MRPHVALVALGRSAGRVTGGVGEDTGALELADCLRLSGQHHRRARGGDATAYNARKVVKVALGAAASGTAIAS